MPISRPRVRAADGSGELPIPLDVTRPIVVVIDGSKALRRAVLDVVDSPVIDRCP